MIKQNYVIKESIKVRQGAAGFNYRSQSREVIWASLPWCNIGFFSQVHVVTELRWRCFNGFLFFSLEKSSHFASFVCFRVFLQMTGSCLWMSSRPSSLTARWTRKNWRSFFTPSTRITPGQQCHATAVFVCRGMGRRCVCRQKKKKKFYFEIFIVLFTVWKKLCVYIYTHLCLVDFLIGTILLCNMLESQIIFILNSETFSCVGLWISATKMLPIFIFSCFRDWFLFWAPSNPRYGLTAEGCPDEILQLADTKHRSREL